MPQLGFPLSGREPIGAAVGMAGLALAVAGVAAFRRKRTTIDPRTPDRTSAVVEEGIYRISRNPLYLGMFVVLLGWAVWLSNWGAVVILPLFIL